jgi:hypothetical protein
MRRWTIPVVGLVFVMAVGSGAYAQTPSGSSDKMDKDKMMEKKDDKMMDKMGKDKMMDKKDDKTMDKMGKDKMMDKKDDKMDKKQ